MFYLNVDAQDYSKYSLNNDSEIINLEEPEKIKGMFSGQTVMIKDNIIIPIGEIIFPKKVIGEIELFSKYKFKPNKKGVPTYVFKPIDRKYPKCLVCSTVKRKYDNNVIATVDYINWDKKDTFAHGNINNILGTINDLKAIQEAILLKYNLPVYNLKYQFKHIPLLFDNILKTVHNRELIKKDIISIDPEGCKDIDDALSIYREKDTIIIDIHIADVYYLLKNLNMLDLVQNITSIYLTDYIKHMLPTIISSKYGSLIEKEIRLMLSIEIKYDMINKKIQSSRLRKTYGKITKNYSYDNYPKRYFKYAPIIKDVYKLITHQEIEIEDSHKFIEALMIVYNTEFCNILSKEGKSPVYRIQEQNNLSYVPIGNVKLDNFLSIIRSRCAQYSFEKNTHISLGINNYCHATSPLRRLADLINQEIFYTRTNTIINRLEENTTHDSVYSKNNGLDYINQYNQNLKKAYRDIHKLVLAYKVYTSNEYSSSCFIYDADIESNKLFLYFPEEKVTIRTSIIHNKINHMYDIKIEDKKILIINNDKVITTLLLYQLEKVKINGKPNIHLPDKSIIIQFDNLALE